MAASLNDSAVLGANTAFLGRVEASLLAACVAISNEGLAVNHHQQRVAFLHTVLTSPTSALAAATTFALSVATDTLVLADATAAGTVPLTTANVLAQQALATDAHINTAVSGQFNAYVPGIAA